MAGTEAVNEVRIELRAAPLAGHPQRGLGAAGVVERLDAVGQVDQADGRTASSSAPAEPGTPLPSQRSKACSSGSHTAGPSSSRPARSLASWQCVFHQLPRGPARGGQELPDHPDPVESRLAAAEMAGDEDRQAEAPVGPPRGCRRTAPSRRRTAPPPRWCRRRIPPTSAATCSTPTSRRPDPSRPPPPAAWRPRSGAAPVPSAGPCRGRPPATASPPARPASPAAGNPKPPAHSASRMSHRPGPAGPKGGLHDRHDQPLQPAERHQPQRGRRLPARPVGLTG